MDRDRIARHISERLSAFPDVRLAILYGSAVRGALRAGSDIDLAVARDARRLLDPDVLIDVSLDLGDAMSREVQVRDLARADGLFLQQVLSTGLTVVEHDSSIRGDLIVRMLDFEADMLPNVRLIRTCVVERFVAGQ